MAGYIGTSGWQYRDWKERFYPLKVPQRAWLEFYAERFGTVEVNNTFYRLPPLHTFQDWARRTPSDFLFAVKASRFLTHIRRLREPKEPAKRFIESARGLGRKLGPILIQLPPNMPADAGLLKETLRLFKPLRVAVEFRHDSWFNEEVSDVLARANAALVLADRDSRPVSKLWRTADWGFVRFHHGTASPRPCYGRTALETWSDRIASLWEPDLDVFVFFNNDTLGCAVRDAIVFSRALAKRGFECTRVPKSQEVRVG